MPEKIDVIDRKILYLLCKNSRFSNTFIAHTLKINREVVAYRIKKMLDSKIIFGFITRINTRKLGFLRYFIYVKLKTPINEKEFVEELMNLKEITALENITGAFDFILEINIRTIEEFDSILRVLLNKYSSSILNYKIAQIIEEHPMEVDLLLDNNPENLKIIKETKGSSFQKEFESKIKDNSLVKLDETDYKLLKIILLDSRLTIIDLSEKSGLSYQTVNSKIKELITKDVILTFTIYFSLAAIDYQMFPVLFQLRNFDEKRFFTYIKQHPNILWAYKLLGEWNYQLNIFAKNNTHLHDILNDLRTEFGENIVSFETNMTFNIFKQEQRIE
jgi:DNA-binding Lrp family transcriptional regulator